jgi:hypothetical protein
MVLQVHKIFKGGPTEIEPMLSIWNTYLLQIQTKEKFRGTASVLYLRYFKVGLKMSLLTTEVNVDARVLMMSTWNVLVTLLTDMDI